MTIVFAVNIASLGELPKIVLAEIRINTHSTQRLDVSIERILNQNRKITIY